MSVNQRRGCEESQSEKIFNDRGTGEFWLRLVENFALKKNCTGVRTNAAVESVGFYERCGYVRDTTSLSPVNSVAMRKSLQ